MKSDTFVLIKYDADEGKVFDWKEPRYEEVIQEDGTSVQQQVHLYAKTLFIGENDSIENYIEILDNQDKLT